MGGVSGVIRGSADAAARVAGEWLKQHRAECAISQVHLRRHLIATSEVDAEEGTAAVRATGGAARSAEQLRLEGRQLGGKVRLKL